MAIGPDQGHDDRLGGDRAIYRTFGRVNTAQK